MYVCMYVRKKGNVLFNDALNTLYLRLYGVRHMVKDHSDSERGNHMGYIFRLAARVLLYASSHRHYNTYHGLCYTSCGALAGTRNVCMYVYIYISVCVCVCVCVCAHVCYLVDYNLDAISCVWGHNTRTFEKFEVIFQHQLKDM